ncbi:MAG: helix-turn-helix domain-containing protein [Acidobacteriota bacterium]
MARTKTITNDAILAAARAIFLDKGFSASTRAIAQYAGVSEGLLFQRYPTKSELFFAAMIPPPWSHRRDPEADFEPSLHKLALDLLGYFRASAPILLQLTTHPDFRFDQFAAAHPQSALVSLRGDLVRFFAANKAADPSGASLVLITSLHGMAMMEKLGAFGGRFPDDFVQRAIGCIWQAVRPTAENVKLAPIEERIP